jgi:hypothetical protein
VTAPVRSNDIGQFILRTLAELGADRAALSCVHPIDLIEDDHCVAQTFQADGFVAHWFCETGLVYFFDPQGNLLKQQQVVGYARPGSRAA